MSTVDDSASLKLFSSRLLDLHEKAKSQSLSPGERTEYGRVRDDLARMLVFAQQLVCRPGEKFRQALRIGIEIPLSLEWGTGQTVKGTTLNVSSGGLAAKLEKSLDVGANVSVSLSLPFGEPVTLRARVVAVTPADVGCRASFAFEDLPEAVLDRIEVLVFDRVLPQLSSIIGLTEAAELRMPPRS